MRSLQIGFAVLVAISALSATSLQAAEPKAMSAKEIRAANERARLLEANREKGAKLAPNLIAQQKLYCTLTDAAFVTNGSSEVNGKKASTDFVEVACENNLGYVLGSRKDGAPVAYDCIETSAKGPDGKYKPLRCTLPGNAKPFQGLQTPLSASGEKCNVSAAAFLGFSPTAAFYEVACSRADGMVLTVATPRSATSEIKAVPCYLRIKSDTPCTLTKAEQSTGFINALAAKAPTPCAPTANRHVAQSRAGDNYYEFACPDGAGFIVEADKAGAFVRAIPCAVAAPLAGGCTLTGAAATAAKP